MVSRGHSACHQRCKGLGPQLGRLTSFHLLGISSSAHIAIGSAIDSSPLRVRHAIANVIFTSDGTSTRLHLRLHELLVIYTVEESG
jgi:hypothetical protein